MGKDITKIDIRILSLYIKDYSVIFSIRQITKKLNINYSHTFNRIKKLVKSGILLQEKMGHVNLLSFNILDINAIQIMTIIEDEESNKIKNTVINSIINEANKIDIFCCIGLFGSRVSGKATKESDWDIFVLTQKRKEMEKIMSKFPYAKNIQVQVFTSEEFWDSLISLEETVVKHIIRNKQIIYNPYPFYNIIRNWELTIKKFK